MKIEEAKEAIKASSKAMTDINAINSFGHIPCKQAIPVNDVINIIDQIETDQPKPVVPQFVAEWLEKNDWRKDTLGRQTIFDVFDNLTMDASDGYYADVKKWVEENGNIFAQAWVFGYEIEKEKLYTVKVLDSTLFKMTSDNHVRYKLIGENAIPSESKIGNYTFEVNLTEQEIKQADERLWQWKKEVITNED